MTDLLAVHDLLAGYRSITVIRGLSLRVAPGEVVALLGANGAGKSTTLLTISGLAEQQSGSISLDGTDISKMSAVSRTRAGIGHVTEDRSLFTKLTTMENLRLGGRGDLSRLDRVLELLPALRPLLSRQSGALSGGEQQMLALGRALMGSPRILLIDELSLGLAPRIVQRLLENVRELADNGLGVLLVEQHVEQALKIADRVVVLARGRLSFEGVPGDLAGQRDKLTAAYLGTGSSVPHSTTTKTGSPA